MNITVSLLWFAAGMLAGADLVRRFTRKPKKLPKSDPPELATTADIKELMNLNEADMRSFYKKTGRGDSA
jgi:hypothetical protein